ncbi:MAG: hypothetical protein JW729_07455 [Bacteroidales bacterium]|nr:hypothetical protein [Bacteroidales bacterium]
MKTKRILYFVFALALLSGFYGCKKTEDNEEPKLRGGIISSVKMDDLSIGEITLGLTIAGANTSLSPSYDVEMIKLSYYTIDGDGQPTTASGALFIPKSSSSMPMLSYHHGTLVQRSNAPSYQGPNTSEAMVGALAASVGFISCLPDYLGLGDSHVVHPYLQSELSASASIDMMLAAKNYCTINGISFDGDLYICGYSEGGYVTMATHKKLEASYSSEFNLQASAPMAGPYDVEATADGLIGLQTYSSPALIGFILFSYSEYYSNLSLDNIFNAPYAAQIPSLFDGTKNLATINASLTTDITALVNQTFVSDFNSNANHSLRLAFRENSLLNWYPKTPIRLYHSVEDEIVPYSISETALQTLQTNSSSTVELITYQTGSHTGAAMPIILSALEWFDSLK